MVSACSFKEAEFEISNEDDIPIGKLTNLKKGDILIQSNLNWLLGSTPTSGGMFFGHAAIVLEDQSHSNIDSLLMATSIFESVARKLPEAFQNRKSKALSYSENPKERSIAFSEKGTRYRLRPPLDSLQIDSIITYIIRQDEGSHSWRSMKQYQQKKERLLPKTYCTLLIWQAYKDILNIDIDVNHGYTVYPNDIINHSLFDGSIDGEKSRIRF